MWTPRYTWAMINVPIHILIIRRDSFKTNSVALGDFVSHLIRKYTPDVLYPFHFDSKIYSW